MKTGVQIKNPCMTHTYQWKKQWANPLGLQQEAIRNTLLCLYQTSKNCQLGSLYAVSNRQSDM